MLMRSVDRAVEAVPLVVAVGLQRLKEPRPLPGLRPAIEPVEDGFPRTELVRQIAPWNASSAPPKDRLDEVPVVFRSSSYTSLRDEDRLDLTPLPLIELPTHHRAPSWNTSTARWKERAVYTAYSTHTERAPGSAGHGHGHGHVYGREKSPDSGTGPRRSRRTRCPDR